MVTLKAKKAGTFSVKVELGGKSDEITMTIAKNSSALPSKRFPPERSEQRFVPAQLTKLLHR